MYSFIALSVVLAAVQASVEAVKPGIARSTLIARQATVPTLPGSSGWGSCENVCQTWENDTVTCSNATTTAADDDFMACYCTDSYMTDMANCYDCLAPLVQQAGTDPTFVSDAQEALNDFEDGCNQDGHAVASQTIKGNSGGAPATTSGSGSSTSTTGSSAGGSTGNSKTPSGALGGPAGFYSAVVSGVVGMAFIALAA